MTSRHDVLRNVMLETGTTQSSLSRASGVRQPSISGFVSGNVDISDDMLDRLLNRGSFKMWRPTIEHNLDRLGNRVTGQPHERNLERWRQLVDRDNAPGMHRILTGLDRDSIDMREVSPMSGPLPDDQRREVLQLAG